MDSMVHAEDDEGLWDGTYDKREEKTTDNASEKCKEDRLSLSLSSFFLLLPTHKSFTNNT
jgi:hypothetical protein